MAWRIVRQPNGLLARFSDVVDDFTHMDMSHDVALAVCRDELGTQAASAKVEAGEKDLAFPPFIVEDGKPFKRWRDSISTIRSVHGEAKATQREQEGSLP